MAFQGRFFFAVARLLRALPAAVCCILLFPAAAGRAQSGPMLLPVDPDPLVIATAAGDRRFFIEIADEARERQRGLMFRQSMPGDRGMLFVFAEESRQGFWMQNTPLALDLLFIGDDGHVRAIVQGVPFSPAPISPDVTARFVLELVAGTAQKAGIAVGDRVRHPRMQAAATR